MLSWEAQGRKSPESDQVPALTCAHASERLPSEQGKVMLGKGSTNEAGRGRRKNLHNKRVSFFSNIIIFNFTFSLRTFVFISFFISR